MRGRPSPTPGVLRGDVVRNVAQLKKRAGADMALHGGADLVGELAQAGLIEEYMLFVSPAAIGAGKLLFSGLQQELPLRLIDTRVVNSAFTLLRYEPGHRT